MAAHLLEETLTTDQVKELQSYGAMPRVQAGLAAAAVRTDLDHRLATLLGVNPGWGLSHDEVANLLSGHRADGIPIPGKVRVRAGRSLADTLALDPSLIPTERALDYIRQGRRGDGGLLLERTPGRARAQLFSLYGVPAERPPTSAEIARMQGGCRADGRLLRASVLRDGLAACRQAVAYVDLTFSADKSVSLGWAVARTAAERAAIVQAHRDAVGFVLEHVEGELGRARRGGGGRAGYDPGNVAWITFDHATARPTKDAAGRTRVAGDPQLHSHAVLPNVVLTEQGRVGGLDLARMAGRVHVFGAIYHARLGTLLRQLGAEVTLDRTTGAARLSAVPETVRDGFAKRTVSGVGSAMAYARNAGLDWDALPKARRIALAKGGVQGDPGQVRTDDLSQVEDWRRQAAVLGWTPRSVLAPERRVAASPRERRLDRAFQVAAQVLPKLVQPGSKPDRAAIELAAARGLVEAGIESCDELGAVQRRFVEARVMRGPGPSSGEWIFATTPGARGGEEVRAIPASARVLAEPGSDVREMAAAFRDGRVGDALALKRAHTERRGASAMLVAGGPETVAKAAAAVWRVASGPSPSEGGSPILMPSSDATALVGAAVRQGLQARGILGPDLVTVLARSGDGEDYEMPLAAGDIVRLQGPTNAARVGGGSGRIGAAGSRLSVVSVEAEGLRLRSATGREGDVRWATLRDRDGRVRLDYAYVAALGAAPPQGGDRLVIAFPGGTEGVDPSSLPPPAVLADAMLLFSEDAARKRLLARSDRPARKEVTEDELWAQLSEHLAPAPPPLTARQVLVRACATERAAARALQRSAAIIERRAAEGLPVAPGLNARQDKQAAALLIGVFGHEPTKQAGGRAASGTLVPAGPHPALDQVAALTDVLQRLERSLLDRLATVAERRRARRQAQAAAVLARASATQRHAAEVLRQSAARIERRAAAGLSRAPGLQTLRDRQALSVLNGTSQGPGSIASMTANLYPMLDQFSTFKDALQRLAGRLKTVAEQRRARRQAQAAAVLARASATQRHAAEVLRQSAARIERRAAAGLPRAPGLQTLRDRQALSVLNGTSQGPGSIASMTANLYPMLDQFSTFKDALQRLAGRLTTVAEQRRARRQAQAAAVLARASAAQKRAVQVLQQSTIRIDQRAAAGLPRAPGLQTLRERQLTPLLRGVPGLASSADAHGSAGRAAPVTGDLQRQGASALTDVMQILQDGLLERLAAAVMARRRQKLQAEKFAAEIEAGKVAVLKDVEDLKLQMKTKAAFEEEVRDVGTDLDVCVGRYESGSLEWDSKPFQQLRNRLLEIGWKLSQRPDLAAELYAQLPEAQRPSLKGQLLRAPRPDEFLQVRFQSDNPGKPPTHPSLPSRPTARTSDAAQPRPARRKRDGNDQGMG